MGAWIAFELVRRLRRAGRRMPGMLLVGAARAPQLPRHDPPIHELPDREFLDQLQERYCYPRQLGAQHAELLELVLPALRADFRMLETYQYRDEPPLACPILALGGSQDGSIQAADLAAWRAQTECSFSQQMLPGGHFFLETAEQQLVDTIQRRVDPLIGDASGFE